MAYQLSMPGFLYFLFYFSVIDLTRSTKQLFRDV